MVVFGILACIPLFATLSDLQITQHDELHAKALNQQTSDTEVLPSRGTIYDSQGQALAISGTVYNVQLSPLEVVELQESYAASVAEGKTPSTPEPTNQFIAEGLAELLDLDVDDLLTRLDKTYSMYEIIAERIDQETTDAVRAFITENGLSTCIYLPPTTQRYYPYSSLASHIIGWVNYRNDNKGAYGIEAIYEEELAGESGRVVTAKNGTGTEMLYRYENYQDAVDGYDITLTIDSTIQYYAEQVLEKGVEQFDVQDGAFVIVMEPSTGAILAWANSTTYDLNDPWDVSDPILSEYVASVQADPSSNEEAYLEALAYAQNQQWRNKAINDTYEPGSTFKSIVLAAALEEGVVCEDDCFYCTGSVEIADYTIRCSDRNGHEEQTLAEAVSNSCNPAFIEIGLRLGAEKFYDYLEDFGFLDITGIDIQGEMDTSSLIWDRDFFTGPYGLTSLATASFGQTFNVTPLQMITAAAAVVNGGYLMQPYVVQSVVDSDGNTVEYTEPTVVRQVISEETSARVASILETVVDGGTGKNAQVEGYSIGGKTGSSETSEEGHTIVSFLGFAPVEDPEVVILIAYDNPLPAEEGGNYTADGWYISGGIMAATMAGELFSDILDYLGVEKDYTPEEDTTVPNVTGLSLASATTSLSNKNLNLRTVGEGDTVTGQIPAAGVIIPGMSEVVLYMGSEVPTDLVAVPDLSGMTITQARTAVEKLGLYLKITGVAEESSNIIASFQTIEAGTMVELGTVIEAHFTDNDGSGAGWGY